MKGVQAFASAHSNSPAVAYQGYINLRNEVLHKALGRNKPVSEAEIFDQVFSQMLRNFSQALDSPTHPSLKLKPVDLSPPRSPIQHAILKWCAVADHKPETGCVVESRVLEPVLRSTMRNLVLDRTSSYSRSVIQLIARAFHSYGCNARNKPANSTDEMNRLKVDAILASIEFIRRKVALFTASEVANVHTLQRKKLEFERDSLGQVPVLVADRHRQVLTERIAMLSRDFALEEIKKISKLQLDELEKACLGNPTKSCFDQAMSLQAVGEILGAVPPDQWLKVKTACKEDLLCYRSKISESPIAVMVSMVGMRDNSGFCEDFKKIETVYRYESRCISRFSRNATNQDWAVIEELNKLATMPMPRSAKH